MRKHIQYTCMESSNMSNSIKGMGQSLLWFKDRLHAFRPGSLHGRSAAPRAWTKSAAQSPDLCWGLTSPRGRYGIGVYSRVIKRGNGKYT